MLVVWVTAAVSVITIASLWCLPINVKIRVQTGEGWKRAE
tara:strand:- start:436 stop:555 length:120 start_codon:yes stop_codon:yes gene_type:complete